MVRYILLNWCARVFASGKTHVVGAGREKQARNPKLEANRQVEERKLGVWGKKREEKPMAWVWGEKSK